MVVYFLYIYMRTSAYEHECPDCGAHFDNLGSHRGSKNCQSNQDEKKIREQSLRSVRNQKEIEWLRQSRHKLEELIRNPSASNYTENYYTTQEGLEELRKHIFVGASDKGTRAEFRSKEDTFIVCEVTDDYKNEFSDVVVIVPDSDVDVSRKRVTYLRSNYGEEINVAFTTDGYRIGLAYNPEDALQEVQQCTSDVFAAAV